MIMTNAQDVQGAEPVRRITIKTGDLIRIAMPDEHDSLRVFARAGGPHYTAGDVWEHADGTKTLTLYTDAQMAILTDIERKNLLSPNLVDENTSPGTHTAPQQKADTGERRPGEFRIGDVVKLKTGDTYRLVKRGTRDPKTGATVLHTIGETTRGHLLEAILDGADCVVVIRADPGTPLESHPIGESKMSARPAPAPDPSQADDHLDNLNNRNGRL